MVPWLVAQRRSPDSYVGFGVRFIEKDGEQYYVIVRDSFHVITLKRTNEGLRQSSQLSLSGTELADYTPMEEGISET